MLRGDLLRSHSTLPGEIEQIRELFRTRRNIVLTPRCPVALRRGFTLFCGGIPLMIAGHISMQFRFHRIPHEIEGLMNPALQLILREPVRKFDFDRRMYSSPAGTFFEYDALSFNIIQILLLVFPEKSAIFRMQRESGRSSWIFENRKYGFGWNIHRL